MSVYDAVTERITNELKTGTDLSGRFGEGAYAAEELIAELTAASLCACLEIPGRLRRGDYIGAARVNKTHSKRLGLL